MASLTVHDVPALRDPVLMLAFYGWNDAADAATDALRYVRRTARGSRKDERVAEIDPEDFFVFTEHRPTVSITKGTTREITWPTTEFTVARLETASQDLIVGIGTEPDLKWKTFTGHVLTLMERLGVNEVVTVGALLADTPHTRPVPVSGGASDPKRAADLGFQPSSYEGPTGIVGAIGDACRRKGLEHISLWASVPHYVTGGRNPKAMHALLSRLNDVYTLGLDLSDLERRSNRYERQVSEALKDNPDVQDYVRNLEATQSVDETPSVDTPPLSSQDVLDEVQRLLTKDEPDGG